MSSLHIGWASGSIVATLALSRWEENNMSVVIRWASPRHGVKYQVRSWHKGVSIPPACVPPSLAPLGSRCAHSYQAWTILTGIWDLWVFHCTEPGFGLLVTRTGTPLEWRRSYTHFFWSQADQFVKFLNLWGSMSTSGKWGSQLPSTDKLLTLVKEEQFSFYLSRSFGWSTYQINIRPVITGEKQI